MVYICRYYDQWDYGSSDDKELENCCELIQRVQPAEGGQDIKVDKTNRVSEQNYTINLDNYRTINRKQYKRRKTKNLI